MRAISSLSVLLLTMQFATHGANAALPPLPGLSGCGQVPVCPLLYWNNFESGAGPEWSTQELGRSQGDCTRCTTFLGPLGREEVRLDLSALPGASVDISFDLFILRSWDGNGEVCPGCGHGPDLWEAYATSGSERIDLVRRTTFSNVFYEPQSFPDPYFASHPAQAGAVEVDSLGVGYCYYPQAHLYCSSVYHFDQPVGPLAGDVTFHFRSDQTEPERNEAWGLDNVRVCLATVPGAPAPNGCARLPHSLLEPAGACSRLLAETPTTAACAALPASLRQPAGLCWGILPSAGADLACPLAPSTLPDAAAACRNLGAPIPNGPSSDLACLPLAALLS